MVLLALCETKLDESFPLIQFYVADYTCTRNGQKRLVAV